MTDAVKEIKQVFRRSRSTLVEDAAGALALVVLLVVGLNVTAFTFVSLENHHPDSVEAFDKVISERPEVLECYSLSGQHDFLLRIVARDLASYEEFLTLHVLGIASVRSASTSFVLKRKKFTTRIPLPVT